MSYTISPVHTEEYYREAGPGSSSSLGADNICVKDMANLLLPYDAYSLIKKLKKAVKCQPVHLHTHNTAGVGNMTVLKAIEAGVDIVDCALSPMGNGTSNPATEPLIATLRGTPYDTGIDLDELTKATDYFRGVADRLKKEGILDPKVLGVDINTLKYQVPGGMLSNLINQLKQAGNASDKFYEVLAEVPRVREDFGYPPLVTPTSQIVGTQAVMNVHLRRALQDEPEGVSGPHARRVRPSARSRQRGSAPQGHRRSRRSSPAAPPTCSSLSWRSTASEIGEYITQEEDVLTYALFPQVATKFFKARQAEDHRSGQFRPR